MRSSMMAAVMALLAPLGWVQTAQAEPFRLIITETEVPLVPNSVMELAAQEGYFAREGVEVDFIRVAQTPMALAALRAGEGEMANIGLDALVFAKAAGADDLRAVMSPNKSLPFLIAGLNLDSPEDLKGKRFGIARPGSADHMLALRVLQSKGVDIDSLELLALGQPSARAQALVAGQIDATTLGIGSYTAIDDSEGISVLISATDFYAAAPVLSKVNVTRQDVLSERQAEVQAVLRALILAARDFRADPALWIAAMSKARPDVSPEDLTLLAAAFDNAWTVNGGLSHQEVDAALSWLRQDPEIAALPVISAEEISDFAPLEAVLQKIERADPGEPGAS